MTLDELTPGTRVYVPQGADLDLCQRGYGMVVQSATAHTKYVSITGVRFRPDRPASHRKRRPEGSKPRTTLRMVLLDRLQLMADHEAGVES